MTREELIAMAREAGFIDRAAFNHTEELERFAALVAAREREACAKVCENKFGAWNDVAQKCAAAIRSRSTD